MRQGGYSRFIYYVKIILPLIAIALLSTVFLFTKERTLEGGLTFSKADLLSLKTGMRLSKPRFSGSNAQGDVYDFSAQLVLPDAPNPSMLEAVGLSGEIRFIQGEKLLLNAGKAEYRVNTQALRLLDGISIAFSNGFHAKSEELLAELEIGRLTTKGAVIASSPMGNIEAGSLRVEQELQNGEEKRMIWFENGVKLVFNLQDDTADKAGDE